MSKLASLNSTKSESFYHKAIKQMIYKYVSEKSNNILESSLEKHFKTRRADVYFKLKTGQEVVVEIQHSKMTVKELKERSEEYNSKNIYILWILNGKGNCVAQPKIPVDQKEIKISPIEKFLHKMYGGRVYYVNINYYNEKIKITAPFALHFSPSDKKSVKIFHKNYESYYIRNVNYTKIPNWNLLCTDFSGFKISRFYDKNIKSILKEEIVKYTKVKTRKSCDSCQKLFKRFKKCVKNDHCNFKPIKGKKLVKCILNHFSQDYGKKFILNSLLELMNEKKNKNRH